MTHPITMFPTAQERRHGFLSGGSNRRQGGQLMPKYPKNRKNIGFWPLHYRIPGGPPTRFSKVRGSGPPDPPPVGDAPATARPSSKFAHRDLRSQSRVSLKVGPRASQPGREGRQMSCHCYRGHIGMENPKKCCFSVSGILARGVVTKFFSGGRIVGSGANLP